MKPMERCDALIVGGGPAGSTCARELCKLGTDVIVIDKAMFPRDKVCAGWITPEVTRLLNLDLASYGKDNVLQAIDGFRTGLIDGEPIDTHYGKTISYGIRRREFDDYLLRRSGARLCLGQAIDSMERDGDRWIVNGHISTPLLIGAGGHFCPVARLLGADVGAGEPAVLAKEIEFEMTPADLADCPVEPEMPELYFTRDLKGYGWCFRKGNFLNIGIGREDSHVLGEHLRQFLAFLQERKRVPRDIPSRFNGHAYLLYGHAPRQLLKEGVLLIGDAAGMAYPESGEGIRPAIESALLAAKTVGEAGGDYRLPQLALYQARLRERFSSPLAWVPSLPSAVQARLARVLMRSQWFTRHVVLDRWFLHFDQPAL